jgi:hypothetical protein
MDKFAFPQMLYSSRTCRCHAARGLPPCGGGTCDALFCQQIQLSKSFGPGGCRAPRARRSVRRNSTRNKKPGVERRANASTQSGRIRAMLDSGYPVFVTNLDPSRLTAHTESTGHAGGVGSIAAIANTSRALRRKLKKHCGKAGAYRK